MSDQMLHPRETAATTFALLAVRYCPYRAAVEDELGLLSCPSRPSDRAKLGDSTKDGGPRQFVR